MQHPLKKKERKPVPIRWLLLILLGAAALAVAAVWLIPVLFPAPVEQLYPDPEPVLNFETLQVSEPEQLRTITIAHQDGESYTLHYQEGALLLEVDGQLRDINDSLSADLLEAATTIAVENVVTKDSSEVAQYLPDMGLDPAQITVTVCYSDGREEILSIGVGVPNTTYSYYRWSGDDGIYMCDTGVAEIFAYTARRLLPVEQPQLENSLVDRLVITNEHGDMEVSLSIDASGNITGQLLSPLQYPMAADAAAALMTSLENFRLGTPMGDMAALAAEYGFDAPLCTVDIHQKEGMFTRINEAGEMVVETMPAQQWRFVFGRPEGEYFYTCAYEGQIYLVSRFLVEPLVSAVPEQLLTTHPADLGTLPGRIHVETEKGSFTMEITQTLRLMENGQPETDEDGNWLYDTVAIKDGEVIPAEKADALVSRLKAMSFSGKVPEGWLPGETEPRWRVQLTDASSNVRTLTGYRLDAFSDAVAVDGVVLHCCYTEALATALGEWLPQ